MRPPALLRRRSIWWPTPAGWFALLLLAGAAIVLFAWTANDWLAPNEPAHGRTRILIVEGWIDEGGLAQATAAFKRGGYQRIVTTGGPIDPWTDTGHWGSYAARVAAYLREHGVADAQIVALPAPKTLNDRTWLAALMVRRWAAQSGLAIDAFDVFSQGVHARRSRIVYRMALGDRAEVGVLAASSDDYDTAHWWRSSAGAKATLGEAFSVLWTMCCFWPGAPG